jgi:predicted Zn-dependent peptidase
MKTIQQRYYVPNNSALIVTGDVKADDVFALVDSCSRRCGRRPTIRS